MTKFIIKLKSAFLTTGAAAILTMMIPGFLSGSFGGTAAVIGIMLILTLIANLVLAIPLSYLSDILTRRLAAWRFPAAGLFHIILGLLPVFLFDELAFYTIVCALLFFLFTEWQHRRKLVWSKRTVLSGLAILLFAGSALISVPSLVSRFEDRTHDVYYIPKGYEGEIKILRDIKHAPQEKKEDGYDVIKVNSDGYALSSEPLTSAKIEDKYFFVDEEGNREKIEKLCVSVGQRHAIPGENYQYNYETLYVTSTSCGKEFREKGQSLFPEKLQIEEILYKEGLAKMGEYGYIILPQK